LVSTVLPVSGLYPTVGADGCCGSRLVVSAEAGGTAAAGGALSRISPLVNGVFSWSDIGFPQGWKPLNQVIVHAVAATCQDVWRSYPLSKFQRTGTARRAKSIFRQVLRDTRRENTS